MGFLFYNNVDKKGTAIDTKYPKWDDGSPNLITYLDSINLSQPIISCQYELRMSRWPRTIFFAKSITIPGITTNTVELNHCGFTIQIPTHPKYETNEITIAILADKEGYHYQDFRNIVFQSGHPLIAGDPMSTIGDGEDQLDVRLRNKPSDATHHHWIIRNFRPIKISDIELSMDSSNFVEFQVTGTFTHIDYDCGKNNTNIQQQSPQAQDKPEPSNTTPNNTQTQREYRIYPEQDEEYLQTKKEAVLFNYGLDDITDEELEKYDGEKEISKYRNAIVMSKSTLPPRFRFSSWEKHISDGEDITSDEYFEDRIKMGEISHLDPDKKKRKDHKSRDIF